MREDHIKMTIGVAGGYQPSMVTVSILTMPSCAMPMKKHPASNLIGTVKKAENDG